MATRSTKQTSKSSTTRAKKSSTSSAKRYGNKASVKVERAIHEMKHGELRSGGSGKRVTSRRQAIAIGLSEARREGGKVPAAPRSKARSSKSKKTSRARGHAQKSAA